MLRRALAGCVPWPRVVDRPPSPVPVHALGRSRCRWGGGRASRVRCAAWSGVPPRLPPGGGPGFPRPPPAPPSRRPGPAPSCVRAGAVQGLGIALGVGPVGLPDLVASRDVAEQRGRGGRDAPHHVLCGPGATLSAYVRDDDGQQALHAEPQGEFGESGAGLGRLPLGEHGPALQGADVPRDRRGAAERKPRRASARSAMRRPSVNQAGRSVRGRSVNSLPASPAAASSTSRPASVPGPGRSCTVTVLRNHRVQASVAAICPVSSSAPIRPRPLPADGRRRPVPPHGAGGCCRRGHVPVMRPARRAPGRGSAEQPRPLSRSAILW